MGLRSGQRKESSKEVVPQAVRTPRIKKPGQQRRVLGLPSLDLEDVEQVEFSKQILQALEVFVHDELLKCFSGWHAPERFMVILCLTPAHAWPTEEGEPRVAPLYCSQRIRFQYTFSIFRKGHSSQAAAERSKTSQPCAESCRLRYLSVRGGTRGFSVGWSYIPAIICLQEYIAAGRRPLLHRAIHAVPQAPARGARKRNSR